MSGESSSLGWEARRPPLPFACVQRVTDALRYRLPRDRGEIAARPPPEHLRIEAALRRIGIGQSLQPWPLPRAANVGPKLLLPTQKFEHTGISHIGC
jgi:hypothetical protein